MKLRLSILVSIVIILVFSGCKNQWEDHYNTYVETVNENVWDAMQKDSQISNFIKLLKDNKLDTIFLNSDIAYSVFAPKNEAFSSFAGTIDTTLLKYHIASHFIQSGSIQGKRKIQTLTSKFSLFERYGSQVIIDGIEVESESPLYLNGKYFVLDEVVEPKPNLYEYFRLTNPVLSDYIDSQDSIILDKENSKPLGFDENGNTVYDTVSIIYNKFEYKYFPVKHEFRNTSGTIVFPKSEDYNAALDVMAESLGGNYNSHSDIPIEWQNEILLPHLLSQGVFLNMIEPEEFVWASEKDTVKMLNMLGDSVIIDYTPVEKTICSNGYAYNYDNYQIPDSLYTGAAKLEAEWLLNQKGVNSYVWNDSVNVESDIAVSPIQELVATASNDSIIRVLFPKGYSDGYTVEFKSPSLFPRKYVMVVRTHMDVGGVYNIYVNDQLLKSYGNDNKNYTFDYYDFVKYRGLMFSVTGSRYIPQGRFNSFDMYVDNLEVYGKAKIRFEYAGPSFVLGNGLVLDYIDFLPVDD